MPSNPEYRTWFLSSPPFLYFLHVSYFSLCCTAIPLACIRNLGIDNAICCSIPLLGSPTVLARFHAHSAKLAL